MEDIKLNSGIESLIHANHYKYFRMYSNDEVIQCEYVLYDDEKDLPQEKSLNFSKSYEKDNSDSNDGDPPANKQFSDIKSSKRSKPKCRQSRYDEDNYALPDPESDGEVRSRKVDEQLKKIEEKIIAQGKQIFIWRLTSIVVIMLLSVIVASNLSLNVKTMKTTGKKISIS